MTRNKTSLIDDCKRQADMHNMSLWLRHRKDWQFVNITGEMAGFITDQLDKLKDIEKSVKRQ